MNIPEKQEIIAFFAQAKVKKLFFFSSISEEKITNLMLTYLRLAVLTFLETTFLTQISK